MMQRTQVVHHDGEHLVQQYTLTGDDRIREEAIQAFLPLVKYIAGRIKIDQFGSLAREDLYQFGIVGLLTALDRYQSGKGASFKTFAYRRIHGEMIDAIRRESTVSKDAYSIRKKIIMLSDNMRQELGRDPALSEIADEMNVTTEELNAMLFKGDSREHLSLNDSVGGDDTDSMQRLDVIKDESQLSPDEIFGQKALKQELMGVIKHLPERQRLVLALYYYEELTLADIGMILGLSESRISQILSQTLAEIRVQVNQKKGT
ncbi:MAG: FliA/WhiG family RNA polymerase sigma factor [Candidatus Marinimicrobia bacterium]|nr:FliA/WhiG family RNA polymerase sigma factor [Candidatus Neomarinimicrobiota bacterium]